VCAIGFGCSNSTEPREELVVGTLVDNFSAFSPDDSTLFYHRAVPSLDGPPGLYRVPVAGGAATFLASGDWSWPMDLAVSPNGATVAGVWGGQIHLVDAAGGDPRLLVYSSELAFGPSWSPDGRFLVYTRPLLTFGQPPDSSGLHIVDLDFGTDRPIKSGGASVFGGYPRWCPTDSLIVFSDSEGILLVSPGGATLRRLTQPASGRRHDYPRWLPDGERVLFEEISQTGNRLLSIRRDGTDLRPASSYLPPTASLSTNGRIAAVPGTGLVGGEPYVLLFLIDMTTGQRLRQLTSYAPPDVTYRAMGSHGFALREPGAFAR
jgi:Tol biopolymer transport system component